jgi:glycosyltransferase involved in cell wall biosynthesis
MLENINGSNTHRIKILILSDGLGWIVDRITDEMISRIPHDFTKRFYTQINTDDFIKEANQHDLVHYQNWDWAKHIDRIGEIKTPIITTIRSFRFPQYIYDIKDKVHFHIINPDQKEYFPNATYIPDGIFPLEQKEFVVGFAGRPDEYKGFNLIKQACEELGVKFEPALDLDPSCMDLYYKSIDLYVCASEAEGMSTPVMECLSINKPVLTTNVGIPKFLNVHKCQRSVEGIKNGIEKFYTQNQVKDYNWENVCNQINKMYETQLGLWQSKN